MLLPMLLIAARTLLDSQIMLIHSISLGSLCHGLIMQTIYGLVKGLFASIMGTYTHFRDFGDQYVRES
ncbi:MAG: hypothetical protein EAZ78_20570 [Oscillatoriales cyanobacterium]|nr:MAG: hypothetical protein EA000_20900 [Oscillatoriales cyanobacterium]TAD94322.1 MAG: hypothetical protein EAZ98_19705 [Oscillatoriales cyanobacterium]TAE02698.1 MAG: hypothetical protein EAZ96_15210 [Oscillatoriales cyanobacterium]TAF00237.1 MAG: hypothetical protein EAZ78_20570 [Oscillatoriales cyanobacterium]TAF31534.1 MAG: hypothetical protein EAZ68_21785 [Oscillatoriales cyanobacterium]